VHTATGKKCQHREGNLDSTQNYISSILLLKYADTCGANKTYIHKLFIQYIHDYAKWKYK
jgi:hypothetical protein